jgi:hypothetical protein
MAILVPSQRKPGGGQLAPEPLWPADRKYPDMPVLSPHPFGKQIGLPGQLMSALACWERRFATDSENFWQDRMHLFVVCGHLFLGDPSGAS